MRRRNNLQFVCPQRKQLLEEVYLNIFFFLGIKYMGKKSKKLKKKLKPFGIKLVHKKHTNLEGKFASKFKYKTNNFQGIIYQIHCDCGKTYIGESAFSFEKRKKEHLRDIKAKDMTNALAFHCKSTGHSINWPISQILGYENDTLKRKFKESIFIQNFKPELNFSEGYKLRGDWKII